MTYRHRRSLQWLAFVLLLCMTPASAATSRDVIGAPVPAAGSLVYPITIAPNAAPAVVLLPFETVHATLEVDGVTVQSVGRDKLAGRRPFGHGAASLTLAGLRSGENVAIRVTGTRQPPRIAGDADAFGIAYSAGVAGGILFGLLATAILMQLSAIFGYREWTRLWYLGGLLALMVGETRTGPHQSRAS